MFSKNNNAVSNFKDLLRTCSDSIQTQALFKATAKIQGLLIQDCTTNEKYQAMFLLGKINVELLPSITITYLLMALILYHFRYSLSMVTSYFIITFFGTVLKKTNVTRVLRH